jgi:hypothetical protein
MNNPMDTVRARTAGKIIFADRGDIIGRFKIVMWSRSHRAVPRSGRHGSSW